MLVGVAVLVSVVLVSTLLISDGGLVRMPVVRVCVGRHAATLPGDTIPSRASEPGLEAGHRRDGDSTEWPWWA